MTVFLKARKILLLIPIVSIACSLFVGAALKNSRNLKAISTQRPQFKMKTAVPNLQIRDVRLNGNNLEISFRNGYSNNITAMIVSVGGQEFVEDLMFAEKESDRAFPSSGMKQIRYKLQTSHQQIPEITVDGIVFDNRKFEGNPKRVIKIYEQRMGIKKQLARIYPYLTRLDRASDDQMETEIEQLSMAVSLLSTKELRGQSEHIGAGLGKGKSLIDTWLADVSKLFSNGKRQELQTKRNAIKQHCLYLMNRL